jgi:hypothetical protein
LTHSYAQAFVLQTHKDVSDKRRRLEERLRELYGDKNLESYLLSFEGLKRRPGRRGQWR